MNVTILQHDIVWANPAENRKRIEAMLKQQPASDLYVLTEMWATGFAIQPQGVAETLPSSSLEWMKGMATTLNAAIAGSLAIEEGGRYYNRFYFVKPDGSFASYDKRHLFTFGGEHEQYAKGAERKIVEWRGVRFLLQVCYDLRFPVWSRNQVGYDAVLYVANWPVPRIKAWNTLLRARAIENQCYVVGVNRVGEDPKCQYNGWSAIIDPYGRTIAAPPTGTEQGATAEIDMERLNAFRAKFPVLNDADQFKLVD